MQLRALLVDYRVHTKNNYHQQQHDAQTKLYDKLKREKLIRELAQSLGLEFNIHTLYDAFKEQLKYSCEQSDLTTAYLKAPKKLKRMSTLYWKIRFRTTYHIARLKQNNH